MIIVEADGRVLTFKKKKKKENANTSFQKPNAKITWEWKLKKKSWDLGDYFKAFQIFSIPHNDNQTCLSSSVVSISFLYMENLMKAKLVAVENAPAHMEK